MIDRRTLAIHEAGHAVVGWRYAQLRGHRIVIGDGHAPVRPSGSLGFAEHTVTLPRGLRVRLELGNTVPADLERARNVAVAMAAGVAAEWRLRGCKGRLRYEAGSTDLVVVTGLAEYLHRGDANCARAFVNYCEEIAKAQVIAGWWAIEAVADELLVRGELSFAEVRDVLGAAAQARVAAQARGTAG